MNLQFRNWQVPAWEATESQKLGYLNESVEEAENWKKSQRGFTDWRKALGTLSGEPAPRAAGDWSESATRARFTTARLKTNCKTMVAGLSDIRPIGGFHAPKAFNQFANMMNRGTRALYLQNCWGQSLKETLWWALATGTGFLRPVWRRDFAGHGKGSLDLDSFGVPSICPVQMPSNGDWNKAYSVTILDELPVWQAHGMFPLYQDRLRPTSSKYWYSADIRGAAQQNARKRSFGMFPRRDNELSCSDLYIPLRWTRVNDLAINETNSIIPMGEPGTPWYYQVPYFGMEIPDGVGFNGRPKTRAATFEDCRLYPRGRMIISSQDCVMYDGPTFNWCPDLDLIPFTMDMKMPWEPMGFSAIHDGFPLQGAIDGIMRGCLKRIAAQQNMPLGYDINVVSEKEARDFDPFDATSSRVGYDGSEGDIPFKPIVPDEVYHIKPEIITFYDKLIEALDYVHQMRDVVELSKARALGKDQDMLEKALSSLGPIVKSVSFDMECSITKAWKQIGWLMLQYMPAARIAKLVGVESMPEEVYDYDPASMIPSHLPDEFPHSNELAPDADEQILTNFWKSLQTQDSRYTKEQRGRWMAENVGFTIVPHSLHELHQMQQVLLLLQFKQRGFPVSSATIMQAANVPDVEEPQGTTEQERFKSEMEDQIVFQARMQQTVEGLGLQPPGGPPQGKGKGGSGGRPPTAQAAPHIETRGGGTRTLVSESK